jgi:hypothetical protein
MKSRGACKMSKKTVEKDKKILTMFFLMFPSLLIAVMPNDIWGNVIKFLLIFYQLVIVKNLLDDYYLVR